MASSCCIYFELESRHVPQLVGFCGGSRHLAVPGRSHHHHDRLFDVVNRGTCTYAVAGSPFASCSRLPAFLSLLFFFITFCALLSQGRATSVTSSCIRSLSRALLFRRHLWSSKLYLQNDWPVHSILRNCTLECPRNVGSVHCKRTSSRLVVVKARALLLFAELESCDSGRCVLLSVQTDNKNTAVCSR